MFSKDSSAPQEKIILKLFVTGMSVTSVRAIKNLTDICKKHLSQKYSLEIIDIYKHADILQQYDIIACPTLIKEGPAPIKRLVGDLSDTPKVLSALGIKENK